MSLQEWLAAKATQPQELSPVDVVRETMRQRQSGSGMREHLRLLNAQDNSDTQCFCGLKEYGKDVFDPAKMPLTWKGCGNCHA